MGISFAESLYVEVWQKKHPLHVCIFFVSSKIFQGRLKRIAGIALRRVPVRTKSEKRPIRYASGIFLFFPKIFQGRLKRIAGISFAESLSGQLTKEDPAAMRLFFLFPLSP